MNCVLVLLLISAMCCAHTFYVRDTYGTKYAVYLDSLTAPQKYEVQGQEDWNFFINVPTEVKYNCENKGDTYKALMVHKYNPWCYYLSASVLLESDIVVSLIDTSNASMGIVVAYTRGEDLILANGTQITMQTEIVVNCDARTLFPKFEYHGYNVKGDKWVHMFSTRHSAGCPIPASFCSFNVLNYSYDLSSLVSTSGYSIVGDKKYSYIINICRGVEYSCGWPRKEYKAVQYNVDTTTNECTFIASDSNEAKVRLIQKRNPNAGIVVEYVNGKPFVNKDGKTITRATRLIIYCHKFVQSEPVFRFVGSKTHRDLEFFVFRTVHKSGCPS